MLRRRVPIWTSSALAAVLLVTTQSGISTASAPPTAVGDTAPTALRGKQFTLVTGDVVTVSASGDGSRVDVEPAPGRERVGFLRTRTGKDDISVIPTDVAPLLASGKVDEQLFNLSALERFGFEDKADGTERAGGLPLIIRHSGEWLPAATRAEVAARDTVPLESIDATAVTRPEQDRGELWRTLAAPAKSAEGGLRSAIGTVWLDTPVELTGAQSAAEPQDTTPDGDVAVDDLVGQINADGLKDRGLDGKGVRVAVLDTGVRATHPDLQDRVSTSENFITWDDETGDVDGHGTHVAGIIAGTGAASDGKYAVSPPAPRSSADASCPARSACSPTSSTAWSGRPTRASTSSTCPSGRPR